MKNQKKNFIEIRIINNYFQPENYLKPLKEFEENYYIRNSNKFRNNLPRYSLKFFFFSLLFSSLFSSCEIQNLPAKQGVFDSSKTATHI